MVSAAAGAVVNLTPYVKEKNKLKSGATVNGFIEAFKKYRGLDKLSRAVVVELIENIFIHEDKTIEIRLKCRDEFEEIKERLSKNSAVVSTG